jgi:hypothetical protein
MGWGNIGALNAHQAGAAEKELLILTGQVSKTPRFPKEEAKMTRRGLFLHFLSYLPDAK